jgi:dipeptidyl aminopeptidase/acylaminoacyl peptidase
MTGSMRVFALLLTFVVPADGANAHVRHRNLIIPDVQVREKLPVSVDDIANLRKVDALTISPDGRRFAIFVRQNDSINNRFNSGWFAGSTLGGPLTFLGDGGEVEPFVEPGGTESGEIRGNRSSWSPDGQWLAYTVKEQNEVQIWRSKFDGSARERISNNAANILEFVWKEDGNALYFTVGLTRAEELLAIQEKDREGYEYGKDVNAFTEFMQVRIRPPADREPDLWEVLLDTGEERHRDELNLEVFTRMEERQSNGPAAVGQASDVDVPATSAARADGAVVRLIRPRLSSNILQMEVDFPLKRAARILCAAEECSGAIVKAWWSERGDRVLFYRAEGVGGSTLGFYAWSPVEESVSTIWRTFDDFLPNCEVAASDRLICARETPTLPMHIVSIQFSPDRQRTAPLHVIADVNPEFLNILLGRVERFEWDTPKFAWSDKDGRLAGLYASKAFGYIFYPPNFNPALKYPVFIQPYVAVGFNHPAYAEYPPHVYAANGFVVLNMSFPSMSHEAIEKLGASFMRELYSMENGFPHLTMLAESTLRGLDLIEARGYTDANRVGIGGVSHGSFVPLYMLQKYDRIAAVSILSPNWGQFQYYWRAPRSSESTAGITEWLPKPEGIALEFYKKLDVADHVDEVEAPILMNLSDSETFAALRLIRQLHDARKPYDAYIFSRESHIKWQPAHVYAIMKRNLDWFRFWLQDYIDAVPGKEQQYEKWQALRSLQCGNSRSIRNYCQTSDGS